MKLGALLGVLLLCVPTSAGQLRVVALSGQSAPDLPSAKLRDFSHLAINNLGQVAFRATTDAEGPQAGVWSEGPGVLSRAAVHGQQAPHSPAGTRLDFVLNASQTAIILNDQGTTTYFTRLDLGPGDVSSARNEGIWSQTASGDTTQRMRTGVQLPGLPTGTRARFLGTSPRFASTGAFAVEAPLTIDIGNFEDTEAFYRSTGDGAIQLIAHTGSATPLGSAGSQFAYFTPMAVSENGTVAFAATVGNQLGGIVNDFAAELWYQRPSGALSLAIKHGDPMPGVPPGGIFRGAHSVAVNDAGQILINGQFDDALGFTRHGYWVWSEQTGPQALSVEGQQAAGAPGGDLYGFLFNSGLLTWNGRGETAFFEPFQFGTGGVTATNGFGLWRGGVDLPTELVLRRGDPVPDLPGLSFGSVASLDSAQSALWLSDRGQLAFWGTLIGPGVSASNDGAIWAEDVSGRLRVIAREGESINLGTAAAPDLRTISQLRFGGHTSAINEMGQIVFYATFTDGSRAVLVSNLVAVPEPRTVLLAAIVAFGAVLKRQKMKLFNTQL